MKRLLSISILMVVSLAVAQNSITGTLYADDVNGMIVFACFFDPVLQDCDPQQSQYTQIQQSGPSIRYSLTNLVAPQYLVIVWRDKNANGTVEENQDDFVYYTDAEGQPVFVQPPASGIDIQLGTNNPLNQTSDGAAANPLSSPLTVSIYPAEQVIGQWYSGLGNGQYLQYQFTDIGTYSYGSPFKMIAGTFTVENDQLTLIAENGTANSYTLRLECIGRGSFSEYLTLRDNATHLETPYIRDPSDPNQHCMEE